MDQDSTHMVAASKVLILKLENGATLSKTHVVKGVTTEVHITTAEEKAQRRLEDAKKLLEAVEKRFGGNAATKKTQKNILKQQYKNFTAPSSKMLDQTFDRLQKFVSQLKLLSERLLQEDVNQKLLRSLSPKWNTHVVVCRNKADLDTMSMNDLYNNLKKRRKYFAAKRAEKKRNKPPSQAQQRKIMCTYLKNIKGCKLKDLKLKDFDFIQEMFDRAFKRSMQIYMLVEKTYPLTPPTLSMMLEKKLQIDYESEIAYQLCKLIKKQLKK
nr:ribonuclease H-like domain-containing protein [Tanacetum cinerariifolium]